MQRCQVDILFWLHHDPLGAKTGRRWIALSGYHLRDKDRRPRNCEPERRRLYLHFHSAIFPFSIFRMTVTGFGVAQGLRRRKYRCTWSSGRLTSQRSLLVTAAWEMLCQF